MSVSATIALEVELSAGNWTALTGDYLPEAGLRLKRGMSGSGPTDRVASTGVLSFALDNLTNAAGLAGKYSPDHTNILSGWELGKRVRLKVTYGGVTYYKFLGKIADIKPTPGVYQAPQVPVSAVDYMDELASHNLGRITAQTNVRGDQMLAAVVANMPNAPVATAYDSGPDVYAHGLHSEKDESTKGMGAAQKIALSGMDEIYVRGDTSAGETLVYRSRHGRILNTGVVATLAETMSGLRVGRTRDAIYNNLEVVIHPVQRDTAPVILYSIQREISLDAGSSNTFTARYTDPLSSGRRVSSDQMITPVVDVDYKMAGVSGGKGNHLNANLTVAVTFGANSAEVTLTNTHASKCGFIGRFNLRGYGLYEYDPVTLAYLDTASQTTYGDRPLKYDLPYQQDKNVGQDFLNFFKGHHIAPVTAIESVEFPANNSDALMLAALQCDVGSRITVTETMTGLSKDYFIQGYALDIGPGGQINCTFGPLARSDIGGPFGQIGHATYGKIGDTLKIGY